jgi:hypothetical protein
LVTGIFVSSSGDTLIVAVSAGWWSSIAPCSSDRSAGDPLASGGKPSVDLVISIDPFDALA